MPDRKPKLDAAQMDELADLLARRTGLDFEGERRPHLSAAAERYVRERRIKPDDFLRTVMGASEYELLLDRVLSFPGAFRREQPVFRAFELRVLPEMHMKKFWDRPRALRVWSAGCGAGEEAYSIAISVLETLASTDAWNVELLATDLSTLAIQTAERGVYPRSSFANLAPEQVDEYFARAGEMLMVKPKLRRLLRFERANLLEGEYRGRFDCIFCLDVLPWIASSRRAHVLERFHEHLEPGGYVLLGSGEGVRMTSYGRFHAVEREGEVVLQKPESLNRNIAMAGGM